MMRECNLDDNDPLSVYLKEILLTEPAKDSTSFTSSGNLRKTNDNKSDSIHNDILSQDETEVETAGKAKVSHGFH